MSDVAALEERPVQSWRKRGVRSRQRKISHEAMQLDEQGGLPGVTREYRQTVTVGKWGKIDYVNGGIEAYGWGALSVHLLLRYLLGLREEEVDKITIAPVLPQVLRRVGAIYRVGP